MSNQETNKLETHYPCGITVYEEKGAESFYMYDKYKIQKEFGEHGAYEYKVISTDTLEVEEVYDTFEEAEEAIKFWNQ